MSRPVIVVVGAGPGVSGSVARRFADEGYDVALLGADQGVIDDLVPVEDLAGLARLGDLLAAMAEHRARRPDRSGRPRVHRSRLPAAPRPLGLLT